MMGNVLYRRLLYYYKYSYKRIPPSLNAVALLAVSYKGKYYYFSNLQLHLCCKHSDTSWTVYWCGNGYNSNIMKGKSNCQMVYHCHQL